MKHTVRLCSSTYMYTCSGGYDVVQTSLAIHGILSVPNFILKLTYLPLSITFVFSCQQVCSYSTGGSTWGYTVSRHQVTQDVISEGSSSCKMAAARSCWYVHFRTYHIERADTIGSRGGEEQWLKHPSLSSCSL